MWVGATRKGRAPALGRERPPHGGPSPRRATRAFCRTGFSVHTVLVRPPPPAPSCSAQIRSRRALGRGSAARPHVPRFPRCGGGLRVLGRWTSRLVPSILRTLFGGVPGRPLPPEPVWAGARRARWVGLGSGQQDRPPRLRAGGRALLAGIDARTRVPCSSGKEQTRARERACEDGARATIGARSPTSHCGPR